jgi:hypothetical protein
MAPSFGRRGSPRRGVASGPLWDIGAPVTGARLPHRRSPGGEGGRKVCLERHGKLTTSAVTTVAVLLLVGGEPQITPANMLTWTG